MNFVALNPHRFDAIRAAMVIVRCIRADHDAPEAQEYVAVIRHIVFFTCRRPEDLSAVRDGLAVLADIPHALKLEIGTNAKADQLGNDVDLVVYGEFEDEAALAAYKAHPLYQTSIDRVRPIREMRLAADYDTAKAVGRG